MTLHTVRTHGVGKRFEDAKLIDMVEGPIATASVFADPKNRYIASGDQVLAVVRDGVLPVQAIEGHLPALFYPRPGTPERILGIALGSGQSFGALLHHPIEHMDVVDISPEIVELALEHFREFNGDLDNEPRVSMHLDDGRHFVQRAAPASYDVVSMEPPPPTAEGVHALYSLEFYRGVERVLREDGVLMQWVPLYWLTPNEARGVVKTQAAVFPHTFIVRAGSVDFMTLSFKRKDPPRFSTAWIEERAKIFAQERWVKAKRWTEECRHETASLEGILALINAGPEDIARMRAPYIYRDDDQRLSFSSGDRQLLRRYPFKRRISFTFAALPLTPFRELQRYFVEPIPVAELDEERARALRGDHHLPSPAEVAKAEKRFRGAATPAARADWALRVAELRRLDFEVSLAWLRRAIDAHPASGTDRRAGAVARSHVHVHASELRHWIDALPPRAQASRLVHAVENELKSYLEGEREQRSAYLWHKLTQTLSVGTTESE